MLLTKEVEVELNGSTIKYYEDLGYTIPRITRKTKNRNIRTTVLKGTKIIVNIKDVPKGSNVFVDVRCDYCKKTFSKKYYKYIKQLENGIIKKDCCDDCKVLKTQEGLEHKYGVRQNTQLEEVRKVLSDKNRLDEEIVNKAFEDIGYKKLGKYETNNMPIDFICTKHEDLGVQQTTYNVVRIYKSGCKKCRYEKVSGKNQWQWKGGITDLSVYLRGKIYVWQRDTKNYIDNKCYITGLYENLELHHIYPFKYIVLEVMELLDLPIHESVNMYSNEELKSIEEKCLELHFKYGYGIFIQEKLHILFHAKFGDEVTAKELDQFKESYLKGLYDDELEVNLKSYNTINKSKSLKQVAN